MPLSVVMSVMFAHHYSFDATREVMEVSVLASRDFNSSIWTLVLLFDVHATQVLEEIIEDRVEHIIFHEHTWKRKVDHVPVLERSAVRRSVGHSLKR